MTKTHIVIGASAAGVSALTTLRRLDPQSTIICIADQHVLPYNKCHLVDYCMGLKTRDQLGILSSEKIADGKTHMMQGRVTSVDTGARQGCLSDGQRIAYDTLFLGTGASAYLPPIPGLLSYDAVFTFHTLEDVDTLLRFITQHKPRSAVVIGAGLSGLECADALTALGVITSVIEQGPWVLPSQLTLQGSQYLQTCMVQQGVRFRGNARVIELLGAHRTVQAVLLDDGTRVQADMVIVAAGVRPNSQLVDGLGITNTTGHIVVDEYQQTTLPDIFAGGDVALVKNPLTQTLVPSGTWPDAMLQGAIAAHAMAGQPKKHPGAVPVVSSAFFGTKLTVCGNVVGPSLESQVIMRQGADFHHTFVLINNLLQGFCLVGATANQGSLRRALLTQQVMTPEHLVGGF